MIEQAGDYSLRGWLKDLMKAKAKGTLLKKKNNPEEVKDVSSRVQTEHVKILRNSRGEILLTKMVAQVLETCWITDTAVDGEKRIKMNQDIICFFLYI